MHKKLSLSHKYEICFILFLKLKIFIHIYVTYFQNNNSNISRMIIKSIKHITLNYI